ncbi:MAG TPA: hypothetical protein PLI19_06440 [Erysipelotrichaceae bacterium]|nr:hypothetical protein [Erysipelotrichaceae bacterium]HQB32953.1 hypothetical protein [Erysipelotrichaceae bacterium]
MEFENDYAGFAHLGNRGGGIDWLEDLFVLPKFQSRCLVAEVIRKFEE